MTDQSQINFYSWSLKNKTKADSETLQLPNINFHCIRYSDKCLYLWVGDSEAKMESLSCAIKTQYEKDPTAIDIMLINEDQNNNSQNLSKELSIRISKKLNKQVFVSFNVSNSLLEQTYYQTDEPQDNLRSIIEKGIFSEIKNRPENF
ncbi:Proteasome assembly chaperone 4 [Brachionus plicatilis]|uniref:Proteasome assembly chaperone 4 n=1 Tax=Brachionus plicatilis TaxID=10195 RepID=A0A3M7RQ53_BRAPC|nr:Proteasome assembly chaperone 4 [Brachionus plicatilis]